MGFSLLCLLRFAEAGGPAWQKLYIKYSYNTKHIPTDVRMIIRFNVIMRVCRKENEALWYVKIKSKDTSQ